MSKITYVPQQQNEKSVIDRRIELLSDQNWKLTQLLANPMPGLSSWMLMVPERVKEMQFILDGLRDEPQPHQFQCPHCNALIVIAQK